MAYIRNKYIVKCFRCGKVACCCEQQIKLSKYGDFRSMFADIPVDKLLKLYLGRKK